ncbi:UNVERIFIED_CONTAM: hypothetical protein H355_011737 [Colinus virginianus]|nr:hypothetical protein H355_011737 [Colinus virginianus]
MEQKNDWTGSTFEGECFSGWFEGYGRYRFASGVIYEGQFHKGDFHGEGVLIYPNGGRYKATWTRGIATNGQYFFNDGLEYKVKDWDYITPDDRRFYWELTKGFHPAGSKLLSCRNADEEIPPGTYNTGDGFFDPSTRKIYSFSGQEVIGEPESHEISWIIKQCRKRLLDNPDYGARRPSAAQPPETQENEQSLTYNIKAAE